MKTIRVVAAVIRSEDEKGTPVILATQRGYGEWKDIVSMYDQNNNSI